MNKEADITFLHSSHWLIHYGQAYLVNICGSTIVCLCIYESLSAC